MKILFCHLFDDYSGSPKVLSDVISIVNEVGIDFEIITNKSKTGIIHDNYKGINEIFYKRGGKLLTLFFYILSQALMFLFVIKNRNKYTLIYVNTLLPFGAALAGYICKIPVIYHVHETYIKPVVLYESLKKICKLLSCRIILVSSYLASFYKDCNYDIVYNYTDFKNNKKIVNIDGFGREFKSLMVCSLKDYKGIKNYLILARNLSKLDHKFKFTLQLNASELEISKYISLLPKDYLECIQYVDFKSTSTNLESVYLSHDILLNLTIPSICVETFGMTIIEAQSYGLPVIVPNAGGPLEIVHSGVDGYVVDVTNIELIQNCIIAVSSNYSKYLELSQNAISNSEKFNRSNFINRIVKIFNKDILR